MQELPELQPRQTGRGQGKERPPAGRGGPATRPCRPVCPFRRSQSHRAPGPRRRSVRQLTPGAKREVASFLTPRSGPTDRPDRQGHTSRSRPPAREGKVLTVGTTDPWARSFGGAQRVRRSQ